MPTHAVRPHQLEAASPPPVSRPPSPLQTGGLHDSVVSAEAAVDPMMSTGLATSPVIIMTVWLGWLLIGVLTAEALARRGHARRTMTALGLAVGPFLPPLVNATNRRRTAAGSIVVESGTHRPGLTMMIAVGGDAEDVADLAFVFDLLRDEVGHIDLVARVDIEDTVGGARSVDRSAHGSRALRTLRGAAAFVGEHQPGLVLVAGPPRTALADFAAAGGYDIVVATGDRRTRERFARARDGNGAPPLLVSPGAGTLTADGT